MGGKLLDEIFLDEIFADLAADLVDLSDDEIKDRILKYDLDPSDMQEVYNTVKEVQEAEALADANTREAKSMANEDQTKVKVTEEDVDSDGDTDKVTMEKDVPEDDMELTDEERSVIDSMGSDEGTEELDNSSETEDKPREEPKIKNKTNQFARFLGENRLGGM